MNSLLKLFSGFLLLSAMSSFSQSSDSLKFESHYQQALKEYRTSKYQNAINGWRRASQFSKKEYDRARCLTNIGACYKLLGKYDSAFHSYSQAKDILVRIDSTKLLGRLNNNLGTLCLNTGAYQKAQEHLLQALELKKQSNDVKGIGSTLLNLGEVQLRLENWQRAKEYYLESLEVREAIPDTFGIASCHINLGILQKKQGEFKNAQAHYDTVLNLCKAGFGNHKKVLLTAFENIGSLNLEQEESEKAFLAYNSAFEIAQELNSPQDISHCKNQMALLELNNGNIDKARELALEAYNIAKRINSSGGIRDFSHTLSEIHQAQNNAEQGLKWLKIHRQFKDSVLTLDKIRQIQGLEYEHQTSILKKDNQLKNEQLKGEKERARNANWRAFFLGVFVLLLAGFLFFVNRTKKQLSQKNKLIHQYQKRFVEPLERSIKVKTLDEEETKVEELLLKNIVFMERGGTGKQSFALIGKIREKIGKNSFLVYASSGRKYVKKISTTNSLDTFLKDSSFSRVNTGLIINLHFIQENSEKQLEASFKSWNRENRRFENIEVILPLAKTGKFKLQFLSDFKDFKNKQPFFS